MTLRPIVADTESADEEIEKLSKQLQEHVLQSAAKGYFTVRVPYKKYMDIPVFLHPFRREGFTITRRVNLYYTFNRLYQTRITHLSIGWTDAKKGMALKCKDMAQKAGKWSARLPDDVKASDVPTTREEKPNSNVSREEKPDDEKAN